MNYAEWRTKYPGSDWSEWWHSTVNWPIVIQDASLLCDRCGEPICGSGRGTLAILSRLVTDHQERRHSDPPESATPGEARTSTVGPDPSG